MTKKSAPKAGARFLLKKDTEPAKVGKWYPAEDVPKPRKRAFKPTAAKLKKSLTPGTIVILLTGRFRGRRAVFLKQLAGGLLLISGPFAVNGVPLRRVNQAYVIATATKVDVSSVKIPAVVDDAFFSSKEERKSKSEEDFFKLREAPAKAASEERKAAQAAVDAGIKASDAVKAYLKARFSLRKGDKPHEMTF